MNTVGHYPKLPLKFILLWIANIALLLILSFATGFLETMMRIQIKNLAYLYLGAGALLAALEQALVDKLQGNEETE